MAAEEIVVKVFERKELEALEGLVKAGVYKDIEEAIRENERAKERRAREIALLKGKEMAAGRPTTKS